MELPTVKIAAPVVEGNNLGFIVINESDFDPTVHKFFEPDDHKSSVPVDALESIPLEVPVKRGPGRPRKDA